MILCITSQLEINNAKYIFIYALQTTLSYLILFYHHSHEM